MMPGLTRKGRTSGRINSHPEASGSHPSGQEADLICASGSVSDNPGSTEGVSSSVLNLKKTMNSSDLAKLHNFKKRGRKPEDRNFTGKKNQLILLSFLLCFPLSPTAT